MYAVDANYKLFKRVVLDGQGVKEGLQDGMRILNSMEVEDGQEAGKEQALSAFKKSLMTLVEMQKYCKLVFSKSAEIAEKFSQSKDDLDLSKAELERIENLEKSMERKRRSEGAAGTSGYKRRSIDKSKDMCRACNELGHWIGDEICKKGSVL